MKSVRNEKRCIHKGTCIFFSRNNKIECEDLEDLISDYMDSELETILEDDSVREVSKVILQLFDLFQNGKHDELRLEINKLPHCDLWLDISYNPPHPPPRKIHDDSEESSESDDDDDVDGNKEGGGGGGVDEPMDCEWTEVTYRRKR